MSPWTDRTSTPALLLAARRPRATGPATIALIVAVLGIDVIGR